MVDSRKSHPLPGRDGISEGDSPISQVRPNLTSETPLSRDGRAPWLNSASLAQRGQEFVGSPRFTS